VRRGRSSATLEQRQSSLTLHAYFLGRLVPVCAQLLKAAVEADEIHPDLDA
jgi:hypothetical protein